MASTFVMWYGGLRYHCDDPNTQQYSGGSSTQYKFYGAVVTLELSLNS